MHSLINVITFVQHFVYQAVPLLLSFQTKLHLLMLGLLYSA